MREPPQLPSAVEGRVAELCRDLAVQSKRMRELEEEAEELRMAIGEWARKFDDDTRLESSTRAGRR